MKVRALIEGFRSSLFFLPSLLLVAAVLGSQALVRLDRRLSPDQLPDLLRSSVDGARDVLGTIAGATITVASVVFSVTVVALQLASSQFSPRILRGFLRDRFHQTVIGVVMATFTFSLLVLRSVRPAENAEDSIPSVSVAVAVVLAIFTAVAILAFIDRSARAMQVGNLLRGISEETVSLIERIDEGTEDGDLEHVAPFEPPSQPGHVVTAGETGWVQQVNVQGLLEALPDSGVAVLAVRPGVFVVEGTPLCTVWPPPSDPRRLDSEIRKRLEVGRERTMQQDISFGIRQLVDVGLRALSPGINDLTTAYEVVAHLGAVLRPLLLSELPAKALRDGQGRRLLRPHELAHESYVERAFEQLRIPASKLPSMAIAMIGTMGMLREELEGAGLRDRAGPLAQQAHLLLQGVEQADVLPHDVDRVRNALSESRLHHDTPASG